MTVAVIIRVKTPGYIPEFVKFRFNIGEGIFTADIDEEKIEDLRKDIQVISVSVSQIISLIAPK